MSEGIPQQDAIANLLNESAKAWSKGDVDAFMACYDKDERTLYVSGHHLVRGFDAIRAMYLSRFGTGSELGQLKTSVIDVRSINRDHALVAGNYRLVRFNQNEASGIFTLVAKDTADGWRIILDHSS